MKATRLTPEQIEEKSFIDYCSECRKMDLKIEQAELALFNMKLKALKEGIWLPK